MFHHTSNNGSVIRLMGELFCHCKYQRNFLLQLLRDWRLPLVICDAIIHVASNLVVSNGKVYGYSDHDRMLEAAQQDF